MRRATAQSASWRSESAPGLALPDAGLPCYRPIVRKNTFIFVRTKCRRRRRRPNFLRSRTSNEPGTKHEVSWTHNLACHVHMRKASCLITKNDLPPSTRRRASDPSSRDSILVFTIGLPSRLFQLYQPIGSGVRCAICSEFACAPRGTRVVDT